LYSETLLRYLINEENLSSKPQWRRSPFNKLFLSFLRELKRIHSSAPQQARANGITPFSRQEFERIFCHEFTHWRCGRRNDNDVGKTPIVWDTDTSRMLHSKTFGRSRIITISDFGSIPEIEPVVGDEDRARILALLGQDDFSTCFCSTPRGQNILALICINLAMRHLLSTRPSGTARFEFKKKEVQVAVCNSYVKPGIKFEDFFDSPEKAQMYVANKCTYFKLTGASIVADKVYPGKHNQLWENVFANCPEGPLYYLGWLNVPGTTARPTISLLGGYNQEHVNDLNEKLSQKSHHAAMNVVWNTGVITEQLIDHLIGFRRSWESNRYEAALKLDGDSGEGLTREESDANVQLMKSSGIHSHLEKAIIKRRI
jgi:hypothetical protein